MIRLFLMVWSLVAAQAAMAGTVEKLFGFSTSSEGVTYQVYSGGCTSKGDFKVEILESYPVQLQLVRLNPDHCEVDVPYGVTITFSWDELSLKDQERFLVNNPLRTYHRVRIQD